MVSRLYRGDALTDRLYNTSAFVAEDNWKCALGVFSTQRICICMADACVIDFNANLMCSGRLDLDIL